MKPILLSFLCCCFILNACTAVEKAGEKYDSDGWSSSDPLSISHDLRQAQFKTGNLVVNPSFEDGRRAASKAEDNPVLPGWETVGSHIRWTGQKSGDTAGREVNSGSHAIKITRHKAGERDEAEGVLSDFLPVIPGNYNFTYHVRLKDIASHKHRLGVKLHDAVVIKVLFFDENMRPIDPNTMNPVSNSLIDNSDKSYSFSNYWTIDDFPWAKVHGQSYNYPFSEGDIPGNTRYVRLFLGLKGTGTMWIDDIDYRYSKWNFTALERFRPYFDRQLTLKESIIPTPKSFQQLNGDQQQGYIIKTVPIGGSHIVFLMGQTPLASYYAATTALQLFAKDSFVYHNATVIDYPDFLGRALAFKKWRNAEELKNDLENFRDKQKKRFEKLSRPKPDTDGNTES